MKQFPSSPSIFRWLLVLWTVPLAVDGAGCGSKSSAPVSPIGLRVDRNDDGTVTVTFTGWKGHTEDYALVKNYPNARAVRMANQDVTDDVLPLLQGLHDLRELDLSHTQVTDDGLAALQGLSKLEVLRLAYTPVTDKCFDALTGLGSLRRLELMGTKVSPGAADKWKTAKPNRHVQL